MQSHRVANYPAALIIAIFFLSLFSGIILSIVMQQWLFSNIEIVKKIQAKEEEKILEQTLDKYNF